MPYCSSCSRITGLDCDTEPEMQSDLEVRSVDSIGEPVEVTQDGETKLVRTITVAVGGGEVRITNNCADCGDERREAFFSVDDVEVALDVPVESRDPVAWTPDDFEVEAGPSRDDYYQTTDRRGKKITKPRYQKHYYKVVLDITVTGPNGAKGTAQWEDEVSGGDMEEL